MPDLDGLRVLVVEDEPIVAMMLEDMLVEFGCTVVGPAATLDKALALAAASAFDMAVLDVNLNGERSDPVARTLDTLGKPYLFATGYGSAGLLEFAHARVLQKPYTADQLCEALECLRG